MSGDPELLYGLLSSTFGDDSELERFLILNGYPTGAMYGRMKGSSRPYDVAVWFAEHDSEVEGLFDALRRRDPGRRADIDAAQAQYAEEAGPRRSYTVPDGRGLGSYGSAELDAFARRLRARLAAVPEPDPYGGALDPAVWPWTGAAAVLGGFRPDALRPLPGPPPADPAVVALSPFVYRLADGRWELREEIRRPAVERLVARPGSQPLVELPPGLSAALDANADLADPRRDALRQVQRSGLPPLFALTMAELDDLDAVLGWLPAEPASDLDDVFGWSPSRPTAEARSAVRAAIERRELMEPLRRLVGTRFVGRQRELRELREHLYPGRGPVDARLRLHGPGGTGKSSLIGRLLLDLEERAARAPASFAYVDFDRKQYDPRDARGLLLQIVRQLRLQQAGREEELAYVAYESSVGGTDAARVAEVLELDQNLELDGLVQVLARILSQTRVTYPTDVAPLVLVLDTFEEVQLKGPGPVAQVLALLDTIEAALPETRTIIAGRGLREGPGSGPLLPLGDLDPDAADAMLAAHGVADPGLRLLIVERFGGHPLTMRLAADVLARTGSADLAFDGIVGRAEALAEVSAEQVQGLLYERILGHIRDPEIVTIAHPGLAVRLVTVEIIRAVLAGPCGLDPDRAESIFDRLQLEVGMFELEGPGVLRHRSDLRRLMLRAMLDDSRLTPQVDAIHHAAVAFYASRKGAANRVEEIYHRLHVDGGRTTVDQLWKPAFRDALAAARDEPLPEWAARWIERRLADESADRAGWEQIDWEADAAGRAESWLVSADPQQALAVLDERPERLRASPLFALEAAAATAAGLLDRADAAVRRGLEEAAGADRQVQLDLAEQVVVLRGRQGDAAAVVPAAHLAASLADLLGAPLRALEMLAAAVEELPDGIESPEWPPLRDEIVRRFVLLDAGQLAGRPELVVRVLDATDVDLAVLRHVAAALDGQRAGADVFSRDSRTLGSLLAAVTDPSVLDELAAAVGDEPGQPHDPYSIAGRAVRLGRTGQAVVVAVEHAPDRARAVWTVLTSMIRPIRPEGVERAVPVPRRADA